MMNALLKFSDRILSGHLTLGTPPKGKKSTIHILSAHLTNKWYYIIFKEIIYSNSLKKIDPILLKPFFHKTKNDV